MPRLPLPENPEEKEDDVGFADAGLASLVHNFGTIVQVLEQVSNMQALVLLCHEHP